MRSSSTQLVSRREELAQLCERLRQFGQFAFDTEFVTEDTYTPVLCLVQVATPDQPIVVDPMALGELGSFWSLLADPSIEVTAHAAEAEIRFCRHFLGRAPSPLFDVQIAAGIAGYGYPLSYTNLVRRVLGKTIRGSETRTEWRRRPLTDRQLHYALEDVRYLLEIRDKLESDLDRAGRRGWAEEEFRAQVGSERFVNGEPWRRVSGVTSLNRRQLAVLRELAAWREAEARLRDRPVRSVATDDVLVQLAKRQPSNLHDMVMLRGMSRRNLRRVADQLLDAIRRGAAVPDIDCPSLPPRPDDSERVRILTGILSTTLVTLCTRKRLPPGLVASSADLSALARSYIQRGCTPSESPFAQGWRHELFGQVFRDLLDGKLCLRVGNLRGETPVVVERRENDDRDAPEH
jgi:ribonuclease D